MKLVNLVPLKELDINDPALMKYRASRTVNKADNPMDKPSKPTRDLTYAKKLKLDMLKAKRDQLMRDMEQEAEPEGGPIADRYGAQLNKIDAAMAKLRGTKNMTYNQAIGLKETTEKAWNAVDVSRKAEKEISNKEWNERTAKKLDMLKKLNDAGKFKKDFDDERLQGWVDQNYSWQKLSKQFKINEMKEATPPVFDDESMEKLGDIISKYVKDPDDVNKELDRFDDGGFDNMSNMVTANLLRDPEYKNWKKKYGIKESVNEATPTVFTDKDLDDLRDIIAKYVEDPDDAEAEVQRFDDGGFDSMSDMVTTNLLRDPEYKAWYNKIHSTKEDYKPSHRAYNVIDKSNNDKIVAKELSRDKALELAHTNKDYMISATDRLAQEGSCGYGPNGMPGNTPGETQGMDADDRTRGMLKNLIRREIAKLKEANPKEDPREDPDYDMDQHYMDYDLPEMTLDQVASELGYMEGVKKPIKENLDKGLEDLMGKDDFKKATSKDVPGIGDTVIDDKTNTSFGRKTFMKMMMQFTDEPFLIETGLKLYDAWARGEGGLKPSRILKILQDTSN